LSLCQHTPLHLDPSVSDGCLWKKPKHVPWLENNSLRVFQHLRVFTLIFGFKVLSYLSTKMGNSCLTHCATRPHEPAAALPSTTQAPARRSRSLQSNKHPSLHRAICEFPERPCSFSAHSSLSVCSLEVLNTLQIPASPQHKQMNF